MTEPLPQPQPYSVAFEATLADIRIKPGTSGPAVRLTLELNAPSGLDLSGMAANLLDQSIIVTLGGRQYPLPNTAHPDQELAIP